MDKGGSADTRASQDNAEELVQDRSRNPDCEPLSERETSVNAIIVSSFDNESVQSNYWAVDHGIKDGGPDCKDQVRPDLQEKFQVNVNNVDRMDKLETLLREEVDVESTASERDVRNQEEPTKGVERDEECEEDTTRPLSFLEQAISGDMSFLTSRRPSHYSLCVHKLHKDQSLGCKLMEVKDDDNENDDNGFRIGIASVHPTVGGLLSLLHPQHRQQQETILQPGDRLEYINGLDCRCKPLCDVQNYIDNQQGTMTFGFCTNYDDDTTIPTMNTSKSTESQRQQQSHLYYSVLTRPPDNQHWIETARHTQHGYLVVASLSKLWKYSRLTRGHVLLALQNNQPSLWLDPELAGRLLERSPVLYITSTTTTAARSRASISWKKAAVGATGGTLMGVGSALMVTPLHPVGHALAMGGLGVLSTEFKRPRRWLSAVKERLSLRGSEPETDKDIKDENDIHGDREMDKNNDTGTCTAESDSIQTTVS